MIQFWFIFLKFQKEIVLPLWFFAYYTWASKCSISYNGYSLTVLTSIHNFKRVSVGLNKQPKSSVIRQKNESFKLYVSRLERQPKNVSVHNLSYRGFSFSCLVVDGPHFRPCYLFLCLFLSFLNRLKPMETFSKQLIFSFNCLLNVTDRSLYEKIVSRVKAKVWSYLGYCFHFSEAGLRESLLAAYLISLLLITD